MLLAWRLGLHAARYRRLLVLSRVGCEGGWLSVTGVAPGVARRPLQALVGPVSG